MANAGDSQVKIWLDPEQEDSLSRSQFPAQQEQQGLATEALTLVKQYLWKHPGRAGRISLLTSQDGHKVTFTHLSEGKPIADCAPHGHWEIDGNLLKISFHHEAKQYWRNHVFMKHDPSHDVWYMTGLFEGDKAKDFAYLQPWCEQ